MAETPRVIIISLKYDTGTTVSTFRVTGFLASICPKKIKSKNAILQMIVNLEKKPITFIKKQFENNPNKIILICWNKVFY